MESEGSQTIMPGEERATHSTGARSSRAKIKYDGTEASGPDSVVIDSRVGTASARAVMAEHHTALGMMLGAGVDGSIGSLEVSGRGAIGIRHRSLTSASAAASDEEELVESSSTTAVATSSGALLPRVEMGAIRASSGGIAFSMHGTGHTVIVHPGGSAGGGGGEGEGEGEGEVASASTIDSSLPLISRLKTHYQAFSVSTLFVKKPAELETFYQQIELVRDREYRKATHREHDRLEHAALGAAECDVGVTTAALRGLDERTHPDAMGSGRAKLKEARLFTGGDKPIQKLLVLGEAGVGKTTWSQHIAAEWAKGAAWLRQFDVVLCIPCFEIRDWLIGKSAPLKDEDIWLNSLNLISHEPVEMTPLILAEREGTAKILYVLDGWDELGSTEDAPLLKSTAAYLLAKPHVIVTTRPQAVPDLKVRDREVFRADREIRLLGFNSKAQEEFVRTYFDILVNEDATTVYSGLSEGGGEAEPREKSVDEYASEFQGLLNTQQSLKHLASNPVLLEILCYAHFDPKGTSLAADSTFRLTPLYQNVIEQLSRRLLEKLDIKAAEHWLIEDTPFREHPYAALCLKALKAICFETWQHNQPIIASKAVLAETLALGTRKDLPNHYALLTRDFGLMEVIKADRRTRVATAWRIKHYSIHEYLAAEVMLEQLLAAKPEERKAIINQWGEQYEANQSSRVWIFITGMLAQQATAHRDVEAMLQYWVKGILSHYPVQARDTKIYRDIDDIKHPIGLFHQSYFLLLKEIPIALFPSWELSTLLPVGTTPELLLVTAAGSESLDWLRYAQASGCEVEVELKHRFGTIKISAFSVAAVYGDLQAMKQLINWSGDLAIERILGKFLYEENTLVLALRKGHDAAAQYCLAVFKDRGMSDSGYQNILVGLLQSTMDSASIEMLDNLFGQLGEENQRRVIDGLSAKEAWITAAKVNHRDRSQWMLAHGMAIDRVGVDRYGDRYTALMAALGEGHIELADWLSECGASFDSKSEAAIVAWTRAAEGNDRDRLQWMLAHGMAIDQVGKAKYGNKATALTVALSQGQMELVSWLVEHGATFDPKSEVAIFAWISTARVDDRNSLQWMLAHDMVVDQVGNFHGHEYMALTTALDKGHIELADWLMSQRATLDLESEIIRDSFLYCAQHGLKSSVSWYLEHGVQPTKADFLRSCRLSRHIRGLKHEIQQLMIEHGFRKASCWKILEEDELLLRQAFGFEYELPSSLSSGSAALSERCAEPGTSALVVAPASVAGVRPDITAAEAAALGDEAEERDSSTAPS